MAADKAGAAAAAVAAAAAEQTKKKHTGAKVFWLVAAFLAIGAGVVAWSRSRSTVDPWAEPWEPVESTSDVQGRVADAADSLGEAAGSAVAGARKAATKVSDAAGSLTEKVADATEDLTEKVADATKKVTRRTTKPKDDEPKADEPTEATPEA